jgi:quercetin dioxygenase-like cupin family protein
MKMFVYNEDCKVTNCEPGVTRKVLAYSDELMMCEITFEKGAKGYVHSHKHLQITYIAEGKFEFTVDGETKTVSKGDSVYMPSNSVHGVTCLEAGVLVDVFNPKREEFI